MLVPLASALALSVTVGVIGQLVASLATSLPLEGSLVGAGALPTEAREKVSDPDFNPDAYFYRSSSAVKE